MSIKTINEISSINSSTYSLKDKRLFINYLDTGNIVKNQIDEIICYNDLSELPSRARRIVENGDIIISTVRPNQLHYGVLKDILENLLVSTGFAVIRVDPQLADKYYVYYYLTQTYITNYLQRIAEGSTTSYPSIKPSDIGELVIDLPPLEIQRKISNIIRRIEEKLELNQMINNNLEKLSKNIFRQYFISYEFPDKNGKPYKTNNGKLIETEYGLIPEKWNIIKLKDICKFIKGKKPKQIEEKSFIGSEKYLTIDVLQGNDNLYCSTEKTIAVNKYDILMVMDGASSGDLFYGKEGILGSTLAKIEVDAEYLEIIFKYLDYYSEEIKRNNTGSAIPHADKGFILNLEIALPNNLTKINHIFKTIRSETIKNNQEIEKLTNLRDTLLPKLMSGEIDVSDINFDLFIFVLHCFVLQN